MRAPLLLGLFAFAFACGPAPAPSPPAAAASVTTASNAAPCNAVVQQGQPVDMLGSAAKPPEATGGAIEDGVYVLASLTLYTDQSKDEGAKLASLGKTTMEIKGGTSQLVRTSRDGVETRSTVTRVNAGTKTTVTTTCVSPSGRADDPSTAGYAASGGTLLLINPGPAGTSVATYRRTGG